MNTKRTARNEQIFKMILCAIFIAIILLMTFIPEIGYLTINAIPITLIHIPVIVGGILLGRKYGFVLGLVFGLGSMVRSFIEYTVHAPFTNPLLSVLPRAFIGFIAYDLYQFFVRLIKNDKLSVPLAMGIVTLLHSLIVLPLLYWFGSIGFYFFESEYTFNVESGLFNFIWFILSSNSVFEILLAVLIGTPLVLILTQLQKQMK